MMIRYGDDCYFGIVFFTFKIFKYLAVFFKKEYLKVFLWWKSFASLHAFERVEEHTLEHSGTWFDLQIYDL